MATRQQSKDKTSTETQSATPAEATPAAKAETSTATQDEANAEAVSPMGARELVAAALDLDPTQVFAWRIVAVTKDGHKHSVGSPQ